MGLTERHWFEDEEPELTERQLEDIISIQEKFYRKGYCKGRSDGAEEQKETIKKLEDKNAKLMRLVNEYLEKEREAVEPTLIREGRNKYYNDYVCPRCDDEVAYEQNYCSRCGVRFLWEGR